MHCLLPPSSSLLLSFGPGDYLYVFGDMDEDGFFQGQLMNGMVGLVPSNFIEKVADENGEGISHTSDDITRS